MRQGHRLFELGQRLSLGSSTRDRDENVARSQSRHDHRPRIFVAWSHTGATDYFTATGRLRRGERKYVAETAGQ